MGGLHVTSRVGPRLSLVQGMKAPSEDGRGWADPKKPYPAALGSS